MSPGTEDFSDSVAAGKHDGVDNATNKEIDTFLNKRGLSLLKEDTHVVLQTTEQAQQPASAPKEHVALPMLQIKKKLIHFYNTWEYNSKKNSISFLK